MRADNSRERERQDNGEDGDGGDGGVQYLNYGDEGSWEPGNCGEGVGNEHWRLRYEPVRFHGPRSCRILTLIITASCLLLCLLFPVPLLSLPPFLPVVPFHFLPSHPHSFALALSLYYFHIPLFPTFLFLPSHITIPLPSHSLPSLCPLLFYFLTFLPSLPSLPSLPIPSYPPFHPSLSPQAMLALTHGSPWLHQQQ